MKLHRLLIALTFANLVLLLFGLAQIQPGVPSALRSSRLEIVDAQAVCAPAFPSPRMSSRLLRLAPNGCSCVTRTARQSAMTNAVCP